MSTSVPPVGTTGSQDKTAYAGDAYSALDSQAFLTMLITELHNQDPLEPMDNAQVVEQLSSIREIEANTKLTETLDAVRLGQSMTTAAGLIGKTVTALNDEAKTVTGKVDSVSVVDGEPKVKIGDNTIDLDNISRIVDGNATSS